MMKKLIVLICILLLLVGCNNVDEVDQNELLELKKTTEEQSIKIKVLKEEKAIINNKINEYKAELVNYEKQIQQLKEELNLYKGECIETSKTLEDIKEADELNESLCKYYECNLYNKYEEIVDKAALMEIVEDERFFFDAYISYGSLYYNTDNDNEVYFNSDGTRKKELDGWNIVNAGDIRTLDDLKSYLGEIFTEESCNGIISTYFSYDYENDGNYLIYEGLLFTRGGGKGKCPSEIEDFKDIKGKITYYSETGENLTFKTYFPILDLDDELEQGIMSIEFREDTYEFKKTDNGWRID